MERYPSSTCQACRHYHELTAVCRRNPEYVERKPADWCGEFTSALTAGIGAVPKVSDEAILQLVHDLTDEVLGPGDRPIPATAIAQSELVSWLTGDPHNMASTPAYKRLATMVRRGQLAKGMTPPDGMRRGKVTRGDEMVEAPEGTMFYWIPLGTKEVYVPAGRPTLCSDEDFLGAMVAGGLVSEDRAVSLRGVQKAVEQGFPMSRGTVHNRVKKLVATGRILTSGAGYWTPSEEVPT